ncbi:MAG: hypothetical protein IPK71_25820 [Myxococcales bacterium]|nr:hypothetical protein [Myxococcales bacterium]
MASSRLKVDGHVLVQADGGPLKVEYALFDSQDILLGKNALGRPYELGYATTVGEARKRLGLLGATPELAETLAEIMRPTLTTAYARGGGVRKLVELLEPRWLFESTRFDRETSTYEGTFLDLASLAVDVGRPSAAYAFQALSLALALAGHADETPCELETSEITEHFKTGERTFHRLTLDGLEGLPAALEDLANRGGGRGARGEPLDRARIEELLAPRLPVGAKLSTFIRALETRDVPSKGPLSRQELWEVELLLDRGNLGAAWPLIDAIERMSGRTPATAYLRARHDLLAKLEPPTILAQRISAMALSMSSFVELGLLAGEAWLAAADGRRALAYAKDVLDAKGTDEVLRERAAAIVREARALPSPSTAGLTLSLPPSSTPDDDEPPYFSEGRTDADFTIQRTRPPPLTPSYTPPELEATSEAPRTSATSPPPPRSLTPTRHAPPSSGPRSATPTRMVAPTSNAASRPPPARSATPTRMVPPAQSRPPRSATPTRMVGPTSSRPGRNATPTRVGAPRPRDLFADELEVERPASVPPPPRRPTSSGMGSLHPTPADRPPTVRPLPAQNDPTPPPIQVPFPSSFPGPPDDEPRSRPSVPPALREMPTPTFSGQFMRGATRPPLGEGPPPVGFGKAPIFPKKALDGPEAAETLSFPPGLMPTPATDEIPGSVLEARIQFTWMARELGAAYRMARGVELRADLSGIEHMQAYLFERYAKRRVESPEAARDVQLHGAFLSEILARNLRAEWVDISGDELGYWEMMIPPQTRVWPFGRVSRLIAKGHKERDLVAYYLELESKLSRG